MRVLVALDQSEHSLYALSYLKQLPCHDSIDLTLVTVAPHISEYDLVGSVQALNAPEMMRLEIAAIETALASVEGVVQADFRSIETQIAIGSPGREIVRLANGLQADLVLLGATGRSTVARVLLGSVSDDVVTHVECSALVVRPTPNPLPNTQSLHSVPTRVLVAISDEDAGEGISRWIGELSLSSTTQIHLIHVLEILPFYDQDMLHKASAYWKEVRSAAVKQIEKMEVELRSKGFSTCSQLLEAPHIGQSLLDYAEREKCDLIIVGDRRETLMKRVFLGSTSRHVLRHADCSVLISRGTQK